MRPPRRLYDPEVFQLEMERLWSRTWIYVGHASQVPEAGDYLTADIAAKPVIMMRQADGGIRVLMNRCAHKGTKVLGGASGNTGKVIRCPYHAWTYRLDGSLAMIPLKEGYAGTRMEEKGLSQAGHLENYRGFIFVRLSEKGIGFKEFFGDSLSSIDLLADRSPEGELEITGGCLRYLHNCNWKMFVENLNDTMHPMIVHASSAGTAKRLWEREPADKPKPMAVEQFVPFVNGYQFFATWACASTRTATASRGVHFPFILRILHSEYEQPW